MKIEKKIIFVLLLLLAVVTAKATVYHETTTKVTNFDYSSYTYTYIEDGVEKTASLSDEANSPEQIKALVKAIYTDATIPGIHYAYDYDGTPRLRSGTFYGAHNNKWSKFWGTLGASFKTYFSSGAFAESLIQGEGGITTGEGTREYFNRLDAANNAATRAEEISNEIYKLERQRSDNLVRIAQLDAEIAANRVIMSDATATLAQRQAAAAAAEALINEKYRIRIPLETQIADLMEEANGLAASTPAQIDAANQQRILANQLAAQQNQELRTINRTSASIANAAAREAAERQAAAAATAATRATAISRRVDNAVTQAIFTRLIEPDEAQEAELRAHLTNALETAIPVNFTPDEAGLRQLAEAVQTAVQSYADTKGVDLNNLPKMPQRLNRKR